MNYLYPYCKQINLHVKSRISAEDAGRQERTAREILSRLSQQPGIVLADEVGMGKTFVALAVAVSVALSNRKRRPVVVMVPPSLKEKWPRDFELFREKCLPGELKMQLKLGRAERAEEFLKFLDDPPERQKSIIFVTHGAMNRGLSDKWVMLALIQQSLKGRWGADELRQSLSRFAAELLHMWHVEKNGDGIWEELLSKHPSLWLQVLKDWGIDPEGDNDSHTDDDPVPRSVWTMLSKLNTDAVYESLRTMPQRRTKHYEDHLSEARREIKQELREVWQKCVRRMKLRLPLLILDEAHHLKNPETQLASLFQDKEAAQDADEFSKGPLCGVFERMLFLTATPFQLGHSELCSVLERFSGIDWVGRLSPSCGEDGFLAQLKGLRDALDSAQESAITLDTAWGLLKKSDLVVAGRSCDDTRTWWKAARETKELSPAGAQAVRCYQRTLAEMRRAQKLLQPWIIRHLKPRRLPEPYQGKWRREVFPGASIQKAEGQKEEAGIGVEGQSLLPFLLAARAAAQAPDSRPVFAEGLASSYEAFLHTRRARLEAAGFVDGDDDSIDEADELSAVETVGWYLDRLEECVPAGDSKASLAHPKISATVGRVADIWSRGEKVVVFCHYIATGRTLRQRISEAIEERISRLGAEKLGCDASEVSGHLDRFGKRFFDEDSPARQACDTEGRRILRDFPQLRKYHKELLEVVRRNIRTPAFLARFFPLRSDRITAEDVSAAMRAKDGSGLTLEDMLRQFFRFLAERCGAEDRARYVEAVLAVQTGSHSAEDVARTFSADELAEVEDRRGRLTPNVRLVNGATRSDTRQRLMLTFNTPFYPEILVASSVMAEGVDLHLNCRHVIHHDLSWNPSTLEQRTGRIDRIGAKAEQCGLSIYVYLPFVAETQDEKQYRVVMDRARWFNVVMGEQYKVDLRSTDKLAERLPFPEEAAAELAFELQVVR